jgi:hypothetical protein
MIIEGNKDYIDFIMIALMFVGVIAVAAVVLDVLDAWLSCRDRKSGRNRGKANQ